MLKVLKKLVVAIGVVVVGFFVLVVIVAVTHPNLQPRVESDPKTQAATVASTKQEAPAPKPEPVIAETARNADSSSQNSSTRVEGRSATWLLAKQSNKHDETIKAIKEASQRGDEEAAKRILRVRSAELAQVISEVETGSYSISDKQKMLVPLQQEKDWADGSLIALSQ